MLKINVENFLEKYMTASAAEIEAAIAKRETNISDWTDRLENKSNKSYISKWSVRCQIRGHIERAKMEIEALEVLL